MLETSRVRSTKFAHSDANQTVVAELSTYGSAKSQSEMSNLCDRCASLDIRLSRHQNCTETKLLSCLDPLASPTCDGCIFFSRCLSVPPSNRSYDLLAASSYEISKKVPPLRCIDSHILWLVPLLEFERNIDNLHIGAVVMVKESPKSKLYCKPIPPLIDFDAVRACYDFCSDNHSAHCVSEPGNHRILTVIDVQTRQLMPCPPDSPYVTLSYVWGASAQDMDDKITGGQLPQLLPRTIEDSLEVTFRLGFRYLWVDKYCIDKTDLHNQLKMMTAIYQNSAITIVAASGQDSSWGLPGVSRPRDQPQRISFGRNSLISVPLLPIKEIQDSPWNSRAWTFQEGLLATRRLIFCENQVYFECQSFYCLEGIAPPANTLFELQETGRYQSHRRDVPKSRRGIIEEYSSVPKLANVFGVFPLNGCGDSFVDILDRIGEYSAKSLSYQTDILNAMLGIFQSFDKRLGMKHLWGVPYLGREALLWGAFPAVSQLFAIFLGWPSIKPRARREGFPSWSWVGWFGNFQGTQWSNWRIMLQSHLDLHKPLEKSIQWIAFHPIKVEVETNEGEVLDLATVGRLGTTPAGSVLSKFIHLSTLTNRLKSVGTLVDLDPPACCFDIVDSSMLYSEIVLSLDLNTEAYIFNAALSNGKLIALHMPRLQFGILKSVMIVQEKPNYWEKVATGEFYDRTGDFDLIAKPTWRTIRLG